MRISIYASKVPAILVAVALSGLAFFLLTTTPQVSAKQATQNKAPPSTGIPGITLSMPQSNSHRAFLTPVDEMAALEAIHLALSSVADGATYVWRRDHGHFNAVIRPTQSFKDNRQRVCRHVVIMLNSGTFSRKAEGIACRLKDGLWSLEG